MRRFHTAPNAHVCCMRTMTQLKILATMIVFINIITESLYMKDSHSHTDSIPNHAVNIYADMPHLTSHIWSDHKTYYKNSWAINQSQ